jgi:hypothetical protein
MDSVSLRTGHGHHGEVSRAATSVQNLSTPQCIKNRETDL